MYVANALISLIALTDVKFIGTSTMFFPIQVCTHEVQDRVFKHANLYKDALT